MDTGLKDKVFLITGASGGIGKACAEAFAAEGAKLILHGNKNLAKAEQLAASLGVPAFPLKADLSNKGEVRDLFRDAFDEFGTIDGVVVNAGKWEPKAAPIHELSYKRWMETIAVNLTGAFLCAREYFRLLQRERPETASLVFIGSTAAIFGEAEHADYAASKSGVVYGLTKSLKNEIVRLVPRGRVNAVCPGWTLTPMVEKAMADPIEVTRALQTRALRRMARPKDIARMVVFLSSERLAGHVTGEIVTVAGGMEGRVIHEPDAIEPGKA